jgi:hypothetical protein
LRLPDQTGEGLRQPARRDGPDASALIDRQCALICAAEGVRLLKDCVEHRSEVAGRGIDGLEDLGGCGLLGQSFGELGLARGQAAPQFGNLAVKVCGLLAPGALVPRFHDARSLPVQPSLAGFGRLGEVAGHPWRRVHAGQVRRYGPAEEPMMRS